MLRQQQAETTLLGLYGRVVTLILLLGIMAVIAGKYFSSLPQLAATNMELQHGRWLTVLAMARSQWLALGEPAQLQLNWEDAGPQLKHSAPTLVRMNALGWPAPPTQDTLGCEHLWWQLMGEAPKAQGVVAQYQPKDNRCLFRAADGDTIGYQLDFGGVTFLTGK